VQHAYAAGVRGVPAKNLLGLCITHIFKKVDGVKGSKTSIVLDAGPPRGEPTRLAKSKPVETGLRV
jgi:hypothetical protein